MGNIRLKQKNDILLKQNINPNSKKLDCDIKFGLSDVSKDELQKRRIPVYSYLL